MSTWLFLRLPSRQLIKRFEIGFFLQRHEGYTEYWSYAYYVSKEISRNFNYWSKRIVLQLEILWLGQNLDFIVDADMLISHQDKERTQGRRCLNQPPKEINLNYRQRFGIRVHSNFFFGTSEAIYHRSNQHANIWHNSPLLIVSFGNRRQFFVRSYQRM